jgi:hypothetical protein
VVCVLFSPFGCTLRTSITAINYRVKAYSKEEKKTEYLISQVTELENYSSNMLRRTRQAAVHGLGTERSMQMRKLHLTAVTMKSTPIIWDVTTRSRVEVYRRFRGILRPSSGSSIKPKKETLGILKNNLLCFWWGPYPSSLKMEAVRSTETSVNFYQATPRHIPESSTL